MTLKRLACALAAAAALCAGAPARADTVLLHDTFDTEHGGTGAAEYSGFALWSGANVDLLAPGYFFSLCQSAGNDTPCVDMEGSGNGSLTTRVAYDLAPGTVTVQFDLAGDQRGRTGNSVIAMLKSTTGDVLWTEAFALASDADFTTFTRGISIGSATSAFLSFASAGPADSMGMLLDNVTLSSGGVVTAPVPEPETWALLLGGFGLIGAQLRRRRGASAA